MKSMCRHRTLPKIKEPVVKSGFLLKKGKRSPGYSKRVVVLLQDRIVVYANLGDPVAMVFYSEFRFLVGVHQSERSRDPSR